MHIENTVYYAMRIRRRIRGQTHNRDNLSHPAFIIFPNGAFRTANIP